MLEPHNPLLSSATNNLHEPPAAEPHRRHVRPRGDEPYARAIRHEAQGGLALREAGPISSTAGARLELDFDKWSDDADDIDHSLLRDARGPILDIGCGPGRMVRAAGRLGLVALGLDVSPEVVAMARRGGVAVALGSVFERVPAEGLWGTALLIDGNVGIGGDVAALLVRCRDILAPSGVLIVFKKNFAPVNCERSGSYRILIRQNDTSMMYLFMTAWASGKRNFRVATRAYEGTPPTNPYSLDRGDNYCTAFQIDVE